MTGQGGWPMTSFLTPEGEPFFCGTYFPAGRSQEPLSGRCWRRSHAWRTARDDVEAQGADIVRQLGRSSALPGGRRRSPRRSTSGPRP